MQQLYWKTFIKVMLKIPMEYDRDTLLANLMDVSRQVFCVLLLDVCWYLPEGCGG
jgi:hypothetical protein